MTELLSGDCAENRNRAGNLSRSLFYVCPVCGVGPEMFERVEEPEAAAAPAAEAKGYRCKVCGYVEHLAELPADYVCPVCGVGPEMFEKL